MTFRYLRRCESWKLSLTLGTVGTVFALFLILNPFNGVKALMIYMGILLIMKSIQNLYTIHGISKAVKASKRDDIIDAKWELMDRKEGADMGKRTHHTLLERGREGHVVYTWPSGETYFEFCAFAPD